MSLLVQDKDLINIAVQYTVTQNKYGVKFIKVLDDKKAKEMLSLPDTAAKVKVLNTKWRQQTWLAQNELFSECTIYNPSTGNRDVDWTKFRDAQLKSFLVDWDLTDDTGRAYPVSEETINHLHAAVATALSNKYAEATSMEEGDAGN